MAKTIFGLASKTNGAIQRTANSFAYLIAGNSKFTAGRQFKITGFDFAYVKPEDGSEPDVNARLWPVLTTDIDDETFVWLIKRYFNPAIDKLGKPVEADGTADIAIKKLMDEIAATDKSDEDGLTEIVNAFKDKPIMVRRKAYETLAVTKSGRTYTQRRTMPVFDFVG